MKSYFIKILLLPLSLLIFKGSENSHLFCQSFSIKQNIIFNQRKAKGKLATAIASSKTEKYNIEDEHFQEYETEEGMKYIFDGEEYAELDEAAGKFENFIDDLDEFDGFFDVANPINIDPDEITRESTGLGDFTIEELALDYNFPVDFFADVLCRWGVPAPIQTSAKLKTLVSTEQAFALSEALTTLDPSEIQDSYVDYSVREISRRWEIPLKDIIEVCGRNHLNLPLGVKTNMQIDDFKFMMKELGIETEKKEENKLDLPFP